MSINIRKKRFAVMVNQILQEELQKGNLPTSREFGARLNKLLREQDLGSPEYRFKRALNSELAESDFYNEAVVNIQKDLMILYENTISVHNELKGKFNWFEVEKNRLEYEARKLEAELKEKVLLYGKTGYLASVFDTFDDVSKVETEENVSIDIKNHQVTLKQQENTSFLIEPQASIGFFTPQNAVSNYKKLHISGNISNALNAYTNETFQEVWLSKTQGPAEGYAEIHFAEKQRLNRIDIGIHTLKEVNLYVEFTADGLNYFHLPYYSEGKNTANNLSFYFPTAEIKSLRIWIRKQESDKEMVHPEGYQYQYLFGIKKIQFYRLSFPGEGHIVTKPLTPNTDEHFSIGKVSLVTEEELPDGTDIEYYVRVDNREESWRKISPVNRDTSVAPNVLDFKYVVRSKPSNLGIAEQTSGQEAEIIELQANGISFYSLGHIEKRKIIPRTERLYIGKDAWNVQEVIQNLGEAHIPSLNDWMNPSGDIVRTVTPILEGNRGILMNGQVFTENRQLHYGMGLYYDGRENVISTIPSSTEPIAIYLNGEKLFEGIPNSQTNVNYKFKQGWNDLNVLVYVQSINKNCTIDLGFDPVAVSTHCYASSQFMEKISLFDLRYNTRNNDWSKYALYEKDGRVYIVVNHSLPGVIYDLYYDYVDEVEHRDVQLKIVLKQFSVGEYTTPVLRRYTLQFS
ncbi:hypothetical protein [Cytobacillus oceanisediminis]|uniref:hypothetical protein n=1 Tax=Cytobacillus oceanisediminis TaxID=665099 RepID=UPI001FB2C31D|nr:hypothetical protein [Cytobacillus oceanisediminis]UOE58052.1 hypothetical protein IRB79_27700 [Cytobacillus oceanisediminis]